MPLLSDAARFIATRPGATALAGAGLGAAANVGREALRADDGRPKNYVGSAIRGAQVGGIAGGALGLGGRAVRDTMLLNPQLSGAGDIAKATAKRVGTGISNMAQRQFHGLTGYGSGDRAYLNRIGMMGNQAAAEEAKLLSARAQDDIKHLWKKNVEKLPLNAPLGQEYEVLGKTMQAEDKLRSSLQGSLAGLQSQAALGERAMDLGMTSAPGSVKALVTNPREAAKAIWQQQTAGGNWGKGIAGFGLGMSIYGGVQDLRRGDESAYGGRTVGEKAMRTGAGITGNLLFGGLPLGAMQVATPLAEAGAGRLGRLITRPRQPEIAPAQTPL